MDILPDGYQNSFCYIEFMKSHEKSHDLGTLGRKNYLLHSYVNTHNLLAPLLTGLLMLKVLHLEPESLTFLHPRLLWSCL